MAWCMLQASAHDPLAPLIAAILAQPPNRAGRKRTPWRAAQRRDWHAEGAVDRDQRAVQDHVGVPVLLGVPDRLAELRRPGGQ